MCKFVSPTIHVLFDIPAENKNIWLVFLGWKDNGTTDNLSLFYS